jgi:hypothetical protein
MSAERHTEWLSLVESTGPFLAVSVLDRAMPTGLDVVQTPQRKRIRSAYDEWCDAVDEADPRLEDYHREWIRLILEELLEYEASVLKSGTDLPETLGYRHPQTAETIRPDFAVLWGNQPRMLIAAYAPDIDLEAPLDEEAWAASPLERMTLMCRALGVPVGLVTNGERWTLVSALADGTKSYGSWYARIWLQEPITLQAFQTLLGVRRCFGPAEETLEALLTESLKHRDEVTDTLGEQVRRAIEVLIQALDRADLDRDRQLLKDITPKDLYDAGLTVMMRLVFLLCAEERKLLLLGEPTYDQHYAVSTLRSQLLEEAERQGVEVLERRHDAWSRLLAVFRGVFDGIEHEDLRLPALGGSLFDPDRYPFLEGRAMGSSWRETPAVPLPIDNRTVLMLLSALQVLEVSSGAQHLSYESLDVEQVGHVYEGLLERTAQRVPEPTLGLIGTTKFVNPNVALLELEDAAESGEDELIALICEKTGRSESGVRNASNKEVPPKLRDRLLSACGGDQKLTRRILPFANHLRTDNWDDPLVYRENAFIVTLGAGRRETGTHYTPKSLTEPIVQHTLEPLVYIGPAEGEPENEWKLKSPGEILELKVCDMAMGSGAFLVQACRWLGDRLVEAWDAEERAGKVVSVEGTVLDRSDGGEPLPTDPAERVVIARRLIASRCLYGVDINPMAVELAKLSLWLVTLMKNRPFGFLDHALKSGDSLLGVSSIQQIENFSLRPGDHQATFATADLSSILQDAAAKRRELEAVPSNDHAQIETKSRLHAEAKAATAKVKALADCLIALELRGLSGDAYADARETEAEQAQRLLKQDADATLKSPISNQPSVLAAHAREKLRGRRPFHWPVEFPEVSAHGGFDAFVGNPPFLGGKRISIEHDAIYEKYLKHSFSVKGAADLCCYFFRRSFDFLQTDLGALGLLATNSITEGDSPKVGIEPIVSGGGTIYRARSSFEWPGEAGVFVAQIHIFKGNYSGVRVLEDRPAQLISCKLKDESDAECHKLKEKLCLCSAGRQLYGQGFILEESLAQRFLSQDARNAMVIKPYYNSSIVNDSFDGRSNLWAIDFGEMEQDEAREFKAPFDHLVRHVKPVRDKLTKQVHEDRFWLYWDKRPAFFAEAKKKKKILVCGRHAAHLSFMFYDASWVLTEALQLFCTDSFADFGLLQSSVHEVWARKYSSTIGEGLRYSSSDAFDTFAIPADNSPITLTAQIYYDARCAVMRETKQGLTNTYNRFHDQGEASAEIARLRSLHVELDQAVAAAYGWSDLNLSHGFHPTKQGERFTISESARREVLDRLLALNHQRYAEEVAAGLHDKKKGKGGKSPKRKAKASPSSPELDFGTARAATPPKQLKFVEAKPTRPPSRSSSEIGQPELLNAIFTCAARREFTDREEFIKEVSELLGFQRLRDKTRDLIVGGINSAIRRGLIAYDGAWIVRRASNLSDLDTDTLVKAINAAIRPGCSYTVDEVHHAAADHLGCLRLRLREPLREALQSALTTASRRGIITKRGDEVRKV